MIKDKKIQIELIEKLLWNSCWCDNALEFDLKEALHILKDLGLLNEEKLAWYSEVNNGTN